MKKKSLAILLALGMTAGLLGGCGDNSSSDPAGGSTSEAGGDSQADSDTAEGTDAPQNNAKGSDASGDVYHMVMEIVTYGFDDPDLKMVQDKVNERTIPEIGVEVEFLTVPISEMATKLGLMISGGEQIDLVCTGLTTYPARLASEGSLMPITQYVQNSEILTKATEGVIDACKYNGEIYAVPGVTAAGTQSVFYYDKDLAEQYNIQIPEKIETAEEWDAFFSQVKASGMEQYALSLGDGLNAELNATGYVFDCLGDKAYCAYGIVMNEDANNTAIENYYTSDLYMEKCKMHRDWYEKGYCVPDSISNGYSVIDSLKQGVVFGFVGNRSSGMNEGTMSRNTGKTVGMIPTSDIVIQSANVTAMSYGISTTCQNPEKVIQFLELLYSDLEFTNLMNYGIEGVHYVTKENSNVIGYPEGVDSSTCGYGNFPGIPCDNRNIYVREPLTDEFSQNITQFAYGNAATSKFLGYNFDNTNVSTEISAVIATIGKYGPALECGIVDPEEMIPEFIAELKTAGIDKIIEENQKQLNDWLATQN